MADKNRSVFVRILNSPIKIRGKLINVGETYTGNYDVINGLPGMRFVGFEDDINRGNKTVVVKDDSMEIVTECETKEVKDVQQGTPPKDTFSSERLKELKEIKPKEWLKKKKSEFIEILEEGGIDYSTVKDDRICLYKFLVETLNLM